jgi:hypothetical protein
MPKSYESMIPSIEQRERAWMHLRERLAQPRQDHPLPSVTISRQYGCEGYPLAQHLQSLLEQASGRLWHIFDKALVDQVAADEQLSRQLLNHRGDESHAQDVLRKQFGFLTHNEAYAILVKHLLPVAAAGCAIIVGRGGAIACQDLPNCFHFRLVGSFPFRSETMARRLDLPLAEAEEMVRTQSGIRERFISQCLHADVTSDQWYDAVFNNERRSVATIAQACLRLIVSGWPDKDFFRADAQHASVGGR